MKRPATIAEPLEESPVITPAPPAPLSAEWVADMAAALRGEATPQQRLDWLLFEATVDLIAAHYRLHRDDVFDALMELESNILADGGQPFATGLLAQPWGFAAAALPAQRQAGSPA